MKGILECCVDSVESAKAAEAGGADRLELCQGLVIGGVTPDACLFQAVREETNLPIRILIRPRFGDFCYLESEIRLMCEQIEMFRRLGADAVVIGALSEDGSLDLGAMQRMIEAADGMGLTLHRAFDVCKEPFAVLEKVIDLGMDTILTSGQCASAVKGKVLLQELKKAAGGRIDLMAGAGIDADAIAELAPYTGIMTFHMSGKKVLDSRMKYRKNDVPMGLPSMSEFEIWQTDEKKVKKAKETLKFYTSQY